MKWFLSRLREPSSAAGISSVIGGALTAATGNYIAGGAQIITGVAAILVKEGKAQ